MGSFGDRLRKEREQRGISLEDIALTTKIRAGLLQALEEEKFERLPGGIFNKGFVRAYARHLGIDEDQAIADYMAAAGETPARRPVDSPMPGRVEVPEPRIQLVKEEREASSAGFNPRGLLAGLLVLVAVGTAAWLYYHREKRVESSVASSQPGPLVPAAPLPAPTPAPASSAEEPKPAAPAPSAEHAPTTNASEQAALTAATPPTGTFTVRIKAEEECWMQITVDGKMEEITMSAQTEKLVSARRSVVLRAGSVGALDLAFNGKQIPGQGDYGEVKTLAFGPEGLVPAKPAAPSGPAN